MIKGKSIIIGDVYGDGRRVGIFDNKNNFSGSVVVDAVHLFKTPCLVLVFNSPPTNFNILLLLIIWALEILLIINLNLKKWK